MPPTSGAESKAVDMLKRRACHSDEVDYAETVRRKILASPYAELRRMGFEYRDGVLTLRGVVKSFYLKQLAQALAMKMEGVDVVNNRLVVVNDTAERKTRSA